MQAVIIIVVILAVLLVIFTLQNSIEISVHIFMWEITNAPLVLVLISCIVIGYLLAAFYFVPKIWKYQKEIKQLTSFSDELKELHELNHKKEETLPKEKQNIDPEGITLDDDSGSNNSFFTD